MVLQVFAESSGFGGTDGGTGLGGGPHYHRALGAAVRTGGASAAAGSGEAEIVHLAHERDVCSHRGPMVVPVPGGRQPRPDGRLLPFRNARSGSRQMLLEEGVGESRQSSTPRGCAGRATQLSGGDPGTARRRSDAGVVPAANATLRQQPDRIGSSIHQTTPESDARAMQPRHGSAADAGDRSGAHDSQRAGAGDYAEKPIWPGLGIWGTVGHSINANSMAQRRHSS